MLRIVAIKILPMISPMLLFLVLVSGCSSTQSELPTNTQESRGHATDEHQNETTEAISSNDTRTDNARGLGGHGGNVLKFDVDDLMGEWVQHRGSDLIQIFIVDSSGETKSPQNIDSFIVKSGDAMFSLDPESVDDQGRAAVFSLDDKDLSIAMNLGVEVEVLIGERVISGTIPSPGGQK